MIAAQERPGSEKLAGGPPLAVAERDDVEVAATRCPWCHDRVLAGTAWCACQGCLARVHVACWGDAGHCPSCAARTCLTPSAGETSLVLRQTVTVAGGAIGLGAGLLPALLAALGAGYAAGALSSDRTAPVALLAGLAVAVGFTATGTWLGWRTSGRGG